MDGTDPFFAFFRQALHRSKSLEEALAEVESLLVEPANRALLSDLVDSGTGREILGVWQRDWARLRLPAPWLALLPAWQPCVEPPDDAR